MLIQFTLSMPNVASWNNRWSGESKLYARVKRINKKDNKNIDEILEKGYYHYNFGDGWSAGVSVEKIDAEQARETRRKSNGFYGYDWMITSILKDGYIHPEERE